MRRWLAAFGLVICIPLIVLGYLSARASTTNMGEDDFRKLEQT